MLCPPLRPYWRLQRPVARWLSPRNHPALFIEMRLGKCMLAIRWAMSRGLFGPVLILTSASLIGTWLSELQAEGVEACGLDQGSNIAKVEHFRKQYKRGIRWFVVNYEGLSPKLVAAAWDCVILDESTKIKNPQSRISRIVCDELGPKVPFKIALSGEPTPEDYLEIFQQFKFLRGEMMGFTNYYKFRYALFYQAGYNWLPKKGTLNQIRAYLKKHAYFLNREEAGIKHEKIVERQTVTISRKTKQDYRNILTNFEINDGVTTRNILHVNTWLSQLLGGSLRILPNSVKRNALLKLLKTKFVKDQVVVWFRFNREIRIARNFLERKGFTCRILTGDVPKSERHKCVEQFHKKKFQVFLIQVRLGMQGLNLSNARAAIYYSLGPSAEQHLQSRDRIVHVKRKTPLHYVYMIVPNTIDDLIYQAVVVKRLKGKSLRRNLVKELKNYVAKCAA